MTWRGDNAEKVARCREAGCPLADAGDARCGQCTGPVAWKDARGVRHGRARSCHGCPMDGLGLPVCWAACPGPNDGFQTDGQSMVLLGGMEGQEGADAFVWAREAYDARCARTSKASGRGTSRARGFAAALMRLDSAGWDALREACAAKDAKSAASLAGVPLGMFRGPSGGWEGSAADMVMSRVGRIDGATWERVRGLLGGASRQEVANRGLVSKQAVSKSIMRCARREWWLARLLEDS